MWSGFRTTTAHVVDGSGDAVQGGAAALGGLGHFEISDCDGVGEGLDGGPLADASETAHDLGDAKARGRLGPGGEGGHGEDGEARVTA
ncbi:hypothetical protein [Streptomyces sp. NPDC001270]|uniref:hypothetical protein n=1 Tax=Streptomyces sp. NPDC001270 TaxID=3364554 RepID=UPI0036D13E49